MYSLTTLISRQYVYFACGLENSQPKRRRPAEPPEHIPPTVTTRGFWRNTTSDSDYEWRAPATMAERNDSLFFQFEQAIVVSELIILGLITVADEHSARLTHLFRRGPTCRSFRCTRADWALRLQGQAASIRLARLRRGRGRAKHWTKRPASGKPGCAKFLRHTVSAGRTAAAKTPARPSIASTPIIEKSFSSTRKPKTHTGPAPALRASTRLDHCP